MISSLYFFLIVLVEFSVSFTVRQYKSSHKIDFGEGKYLSGVDIKFSSNLPDIRGYFGIRYASLGKIKNEFYTENRFEPPVASFFYEEFVGNVLKDKFSPVCPQNIPNMTDFDINPHLFNSYWHHIKRIVPFLIHQDEECLTLNLFIPEKNNTKRIPVLLFIHGESFELGSGNAYDLSILSSYGQIIGITLNYRLGLLGFLKSDDGKAKGNYAFFDIYAALEWISNNIHRFNGDPDNVTLMGYGHGAALAHLFSLSKMLQDVKKKLFHRLILLNGNGLANWSWSQFPHMYMDVLAKHLNTSESQIVDLLKQESFMNILLATKSTPPFHFSTRIGPTISNQFFTYGSKYSKVIVPSNPAFFRDLDVMVGLNENNAGFFFNAPMHIERKDFTDLYFQNKLKEFIRENYVYNQQSIYEILLHMYTDWKNPESEYEIDRKNSRISMFNQMLNDVFFITPAIQFCNIHSSINSNKIKKGNTFLYMFSKLITSKKGKLVEDAQFSDDLMMLLGMPLISSFDPYQDDSKYSYSDGELSKKMMTYLSNFVKYGNPNEPKQYSKDNSPFDLHNQPSLEYWPQYTNTEKHYINFDFKTSNGISIRANLEQAHFRIWNELIPRLHQSFNYPIDFHKHVAVGLDTTQNDYNYNIKFIVPKDPIYTSTSKISTSTSPLRTLKLDISVTKTEKSSDTLYIPHYEQNRNDEDLLSSTIKEESVVDNLGSTSYNLKNYSLLWTILAGTAFFLINSMAIMCIYMNIRKLKSLRQATRGPANTSLSPLRLEFDNEQPVDLNYSGSDLKTPLDIKQETTFLISNQSPDMFSVSREITSSRSTVKLFNSNSTIKYPYESTETKLSYFRVCDNDPVTIV